AVLVRAGDHQHVVADHSLITGKNVGRDAEAGDVADVAGAVGIGPGNRGEYALWHALNPIRSVPAARTKPHPPGLVPTREGGAGCTGDRRGGLASAGGAA